MAGKRSKKRTLVATLYCYVEPQLATHARVQGSSGKWGSFSNYVNYLLAREAGDKAAVARSKLTAKESSQPVMARTLGPAPVRKKLTKKRRRKQARAA